MLVCSLLGVQTAFAVDPVLVDDFEYGADGTPLSSPWVNFATPGRAEYDTVQKKNGALSGWVKGPATATYAGVGETASAGMNLDSAYQTFWVYFDNTTSRRFVEDFASADADKTFSIYFNPTGTAIQIYTSRTGYTAYPANNYSTVGTFTSGWTEYRIVYNLTAKTYTLSKRANSGDAWTQLKAASATSSVTLQKTGDNEEIFVLRAQEASAPRSVILWIADNLHASDEKLREAFECALRMRRHPKKNPAD